MTYGIKVINQANVTQIDSDFANYCVYSTGTIGAGDTNIARPAIAGAKLFLELVNGNEVFCEYHYSGVWQVRSTNYSIQYAIIVPSYAHQSGVNTGYGLNIYKADGSLAFSTNRIYTNILNMCVVNDSRVTQSFSLQIANSGKVRFVDASALYKLGEWNVLFEDGFYDQGNFTLSAYLGGNTLTINSSYAGDVGYISTGQANYWSISEKRYILIIEK